MVSFMLVRVLFDNQNDVRSIFYSASNSSQLYELQIIDSKDLPTFILKDYFTLRVCFVVLR